MFELIPSAFISYVVKPDIRNCNKYIEKKAQRQTRSYWGSGIVSFFLKKKAIAVDRRRGSRTANMTDPEFRVIKLPIGI